MKTGDVARVQESLGALLGQLDSAVAALSAAMPQFQVLLILTLVDLLGYLSVGSSVSKNAVSFVRKYLGRRNQRYAEIGGLLYHMVRHGLVHDQKWKRVRLQDGSDLTIRVTRGSPRTHLRVERGKPDTPWENTLWLNVDVGQLWTDIKASVSDFLGDLAQDECKLRTCVTAMDRLVAAQLKSAVKNCAQDFAFLTRPA